MSLGAKRGDKRKTTRLSFSLHPPPTTAPPPPAVLILFAGLQGKVGQLPRQGLLGKHGGCQAVAVAAAVSHSAFFFFRQSWCSAKGLDSASELYGWTGPTPGWSPPEPPEPPHHLSLFFLFLFIHFNSLTSFLSVTQSDCCSLSLSSTAPSSRLDAKGFLPNIRQLPWRQREREGGEDTSE